MRFEKPRANWRIALPDMALRDDELSDSGKESSLAIHLVQSPPITFPTQIHSTSNSKVTTVTLMFQTPQYTAAFLLD